MRMSDFKEYQKAKTRLVQLSELASTDTEFDLMADAQSSFEQFTDEVVSVIDDLQWQIDDLKNQKSDLEDELRDKSCTIRQLEDDIYTLQQRGDYYG